MSVTAILLAAGYATRLYPLTKDTPKTLLPLTSGVILDAILTSLATVPEVRRRVLVTNHRFAEQFRAWQRATGAAVEIIDDGTDAAETRLGAVRDLELAQRRADAGDDLLVLGTDNLFRWPLAQFVSAAERFKPAPSIALAQAASRQAATQLGVVLRDATQRVTAFVEKSPQPPSLEAALCVYYFPAAMSGQIQRFLASGGNPDAPGYLLEWLVREGPVYGVMMPGVWYDIGTLEAYQAVLKEW